MVIYVYEYFEMKSRPLGHGNEGAGANRVRGLGNDRRDCVCELRESGGWVVGVTVWIPDVVEARALVFAQRDTVPDAQGQVGLESK
jgi:hypothetical protein